MSVELGFIGAGNMAEAIARAAIDKQILRPEQMLAADPSAARRALFAGLGITVADNNARVIAESRQVMLAVKPQVAGKLAADLAAFDPKRQILLSIMAGISTARVAALTGRNARVVRIMPNTPMMVGRGMAGIAVGAHARPGDEDLALRLFSAAGQAVVVEEALIDAITAVSGSGPAYVYYLAQAMERAAAELGLAEHARLLVRQTILGAAQMLDQSPDSAVELTRKVASPGGTTEAAIKHLDGNKTTEVIVNAIKAAHQRGRELGA